MGDSKLLLRLFRTLSGFFIGTILVIIAVNISKKNIDKWKNAIKISILSLLWTISFITANILSSGKLISILNILTLGVLISSVITLVRGRKVIEIEPDSYQFGFIWVGLILLIPFILIGTFLGF